jgi:chromosome segregation ATPase
MVLQMTNKKTNDYAFYSKPLKQVFDTLEELKAAEAKYFGELKAKEDKAAQKKADAQKVEEAFKALNAARKTFKDDMAQLTKEYSDELTRIKNAFEHGKKDIHGSLAAAEDQYSKALKAFTDKYPEGYHLTMRDGDFETTISGSNKAQVVTNNAKAKEVKKADSDLVSLIDLFNLFGF